MPLKCLQLHDFRDYGIHNMILRPLHTCSASAIMCNCRTVNYYHDNTLLEAEPEPEPETEAGQESLAALAYTCS